MDEIRLKEARERLERLRSVLPARGRVFIVPHDYPDPDALASAAALHLLLAKYCRVQGQIVFTGTVSRAENIELLRHYRYAWRFLDQVRVPRRKVPCLFVDSLPRSGNVTTPPFGRPVAVIDHHAYTRKLPNGGMYTDIRKGTGASASIVYEYLVAAEVAIPKWLAAIMAYAIAAETLDLSRNCTDLDLEAYTALLARSSIPIVGRIRHAPLPRSYYVQLQEAIRNAYVFGRVAWTHLDAVEQIEIVAEVADLLCRMERINWAFCTAYKGDRLNVSLRSGRAGARCGSILRSVVRKNGEAGGHAWMAAGYLNVAGLDPVEREARRETLVKNLLKRIERRPLPSERIVEAARPLVSADWDPSDGAGR
jgi:nanoRNase/pAp phosphatase (c-di-AMP/oligoRNAs hydrolase)